MAEVKLTLQELLSLYTGGRPVGTRDFDIQYKEFYDNYGAIMGVDFNTPKGQAIKDNERYDIVGLVKKLDASFPQLKKSEKFREICKDFIKRSPTLYGYKVNAMIINYNEYQIYGQRLMKEARSILGSEKYFVVKNQKKSGR